MRRICLRVEQIALLLAMTSLMIPALPVFGVAWVAGKTLAKLSGDLRAISDELSDGRA